MLLCNKKSGEHNKMTAKITLEKIITMNKNKYISLLPLKYQGRAQEFYNKEYNIMSEQGKHHLDCIQYAFYRLKFEFMRELIEGSLR